jgi:hypothetical protein
MHIVGDYNDRMYIEHGGDSDLHTPATGSMDFGQLFHDASEEPTDTAAKPDPAEEDTPEQLLPPNLDLDDVNATGPDEAEEHPHRDPDTDRLIALINERKELHRAVDELRLKALSLAQQCEILDLFPELKKWLPDARRKGLLPVPSLPRPTHQEAVDKVTSIETEIRSIEARVDAISAELRRAQP